MGVNLYPCMNACMHAQMTGDLPLLSTLHNSHSCCQMHDCYNFGLQLILAIIVIL